MAFLEGKDFSLHTRETKKGPVFYAQFKIGPGKWSNAKTTKILDLGRKKDRSDAVSWCNDYLASGQILTREKTKFKDFAEKFFSWEGEFAKEKRLRGRKISEEQCEKHAQNIKLHALPVFGEKKLDSIEEDDIRQWQRDMSDSGLSGGTINRVSVALRLILKGAYRKKLIRQIPTVEAVAETPESRGIYTPKEIRDLFTQEWPDIRHRVANLIACATGCRASEIVGLQEKHLHPDHLDIVQGWNPRYKKIGPTKNRKSRIVPIPRIVHDEIVSLLKANPFDEGPERFLFYSRLKDQPMNQEHATDGLYKMLKKIGIDDAERERRGLDFHAWRHSFNSLLIGARVPMQTVQETVGHLSPAMSQLYYHIGERELEGIRKIQEGIFDEG